jgi:hypothetical protein
MARTFNDLLLFRNDENLILFRSKRTQQVKARMMFCFLARELGFPTHATGEFLGIQQAAVSNSVHNGATIAKRLKTSWE